MLRDGKPISAAEFVLSFLASFYFLSRQGSHDIDNLRIERNQLYDAYRQGRILAFRSKNLNPDLPTREFLDFLFRNTIFTQDISRVLQRKLS